jgi:hypothetical protein
MKMMMMMTTTTASMVWLITVTMRYFLRHDL